MPGEAAAIALLMFVMSDVEFVQVIVEPDCTRAGGVQGFVIVSVQFAVAPLHGLGELHEAVP